MKPISVSIVIVVALAVAAVSFPEPSIASDDADALLVVDCLLPPQIRKLGARVTYAAPRRPVRTSGADCAERGGEYALPRAAKQASALAIWIPAARAGDAAAQHRVGEIYERGLGGNEDPELAAIWYRRAAQQGHEAAMVQLGQLHEIGSGVERDTAEALRWYERASGLDTGAGGFVPFETPVHEDRVLARKLEQREAEISKLRAELAASRERLDRLVAEREAESATAAEERARLDRERTELAVREEELAAEKAALETEREELDARREQADEDLSSVSESLETREEALRKRVEKFDAAKERIAENEKAMSARSEEIARQERQIDALRAEVEAATSTNPTDPEPVLPVAPPSIQLIEPNLPPTRGLVVSVPASSAEQRVIVGRVVAPAGLLALTLNGREISADSRGLFRTRVEVEDAGLDVTIAAVDRRGERATRRLRFDPTRRAAPPPRPTIDFGRYVALVIGNDRYRGLPSLSTAVADATRVAEVLEGRYGFEVRLLTNATRYDVLTALNDLRTELTAEHNFLLYYAGHGELDEANARGHWLPIDAESDSTANWISNVSITDVLNSMAARHVLVVADSCYSGTLTRASLANLAGDLSDEQRDAWIRAILPKRSRTALTSGGLEPVLDIGGGRHSIFARTLLEVLESNEEVLEGQRLFREVSARVTWAASNMRFDQVPQYAPIKFAGHEAGDFFFVPRDR